MKKKAKKLVSMLLAAVLMLTMVPLSAGAEVIGSGDTYGNWRWSLDRDTGTLTISGLGSMENYYSATDAPWYPLRNEIRTAIFSEGVTNIGDNAFASATVTDEGYNNLSKIILPQSVTNIGYGVFSQMRTLYDCLPIYSAGPAGGGYDYEFQWTDRIPDRAFCALRGLQQITIPESVTYIGDFAFWGCGITSIDLPSSLKELGPYAFSNSSLRSVSIPEGITKLDDSLFESSNLESIFIPVSVTTIESYVFHACNLSDVYYGGTKEQWDRIRIYEHNPELENATIHFNSIEPNDPGPGQSSDDIETVEEIHQFQNWDIFTNTVYFRDGTSYKLSDTYGSVNIEDLLDNWVVCTIRKDSSKGN